MELCVYHHFLPYPIRYHLSSAGCELLLVLAATQAFCKYRRLHLSHRKIQSTGYFYAKLNQHFHLQFQSYLSEFIFDRNLNPFRASRSCPLRKYKAATSTVLCLHRGRAQCLWLCPSRAVLHVDKQYLGCLFFLAIPSLSLLVEMYRNLSGERMLTCVILGEFALCRRTSACLVPSCSSSEGSGEGVRRRR